MSNISLELPPALTIATPKTFSRRPLRRPASFSFQDKGFRLWSHRTYASQGSESTMPGSREQMEQDRDDPSSNYNSPTSPSPSSPTRQILRSIRRSVSSLSPRSGKHSSPTSPQDSSISRAARNSSSRIQGHDLSNPGYSDDLRHTAIVNKGVYAVSSGSSYRAYSQVDITRNHLPQISAPSSPSSSPRVPARMPGRHTDPMNSHSFSPISDNPWVPAKQHQRPHTALPTQTTFDQDQISIPRSQPTRGLSNSSAPAASVSTASRMADSNSNPEADAEFTSPSEFALFAEATSSLGILPSEPTPFAMQPRRASPPMRPQPYHYASQYALPAPRPQSYAPPPLQAPLPSFAAPPFAPPNFSQTHSFPMSQPYSVPGSDAPGQAQPSYHYHQHIHLAAPIPPANRSRSVPPTTATQHLHQRTPSAALPALPATMPPLPIRELSRQQMIAEALTGLDDGGPGSDDELPDYATSQAEANAVQRQAAAQRARELEEGWRRGRQQRAHKPWRAWEQNGWMQG
ncbi:hypothetical protein BT63DRAFT_278989 [Microthyrium microscopicum]|uniref:Uncharacterized protein n=1 Tax=Microthyrium microscopicum TaxID=703497 RepID=A0A6A6U8C2_9PEZI|nr:hypothetical protein BT63DRAFT_278989 [Microthyrium microscopicum]